MARAAVAAPARVTMFTRGGTYQLQAVQASYGANGINVCLCTLSIGRAEGGGTVGIQFNRGDEVTVTVSNATVLSEPANSLYDFLTADTFTLFKGVIDDFGPSNLQFGTFSVTVRIVGRLSRLASGTLETSNIVPKSYHDVAVGWSMGAGLRDPDQFDLSAESLWPEMRSVFNSIAVNNLAAPGDTITAAIIELFGTSVNAVAASVISDISGTLNWNSFASDMKEGIIGHMNQMMQSHWFYESFFNRIVGFGEMLRFAVIETGMALRVAPYHPFFRRSDAKIVPARTIHNIQWSPAARKNYAGTLLTTSSGADTENTSGDDLVIGAYKMLGNPFGQVHVGPAPPYVVTMTPAMSEGLDGPRSVLRAGTSEVGNRLAKIMTWELNYGNRRMSFSSPLLRGDIGPLEAVRVDFPNVEEIQAGVDTPAVYGSVQRVTVSIDAMRQYASTTYDLDYVRSYAQQRNLIDPDLGAGEHPFFNTNYIGGRLDFVQPRGVSIV